ncbi:Uncharacterised protein [Vibrio cholerae]|nr:Uncharacterised protein [Vibrio cholerae]
MWLRCGDLPQCKCAFSMRAYLAFVRRESRSKQRNRSKPRQDKRYTLDSKSDEKREDRSHLDTVRSS